MALGLPVVVNHPICRYVLVSCTDTNIYKPIFYKTTIQICVFYLINLTMFFKYRLTSFAKNVIINKLLYYIHVFKREKLGSNSLMSQIRDL